MFDWMLGVLIKAVDKGVKCKQSWAAVLAGLGRQGAGLKIGQYVI